LQKVRKDRTFCKQLSPIGPEPTSLPVLVNMNTAQEKMTLLRTLITNSTALVGVKIFMPLSYFIVTVNIARILGVEAFGEFAIIFSYYGIFRLISVFGVDAFLVKEVATNEQKANEYLSNAFVVGSLISGASILLMNALLYIMGYSQEIRLAGFALSLSLLAASLMQYTESVFIAFRKSWYMFFTTLFREALKIVLVLFVLFKYQRLVPVVIAISSTYYLGLLVNWLVVNRFVFRHRLSLRTEVIRRIFRISAVLVLISGVNHLLLVTDIIILSKIKGAAPVGLYNAAYKFVTFSFLFIDSLGQTLLPLMSRFHQESSLHFKTALEITLKYFLAIILLFVLTIFFFSDRIVPLIFGDPFQEASTVLRVLIWVPLFLGTSYYLQRMLFVANKQRYDLISLCIVCLINLGLNIGFTIRWGAIGTAAATLISVALLLAFHIVFFQTKVVRLDIGHVWLRPLLAGAAFFICLFYGSRVNLPMAFLGSTVLYLFLLFALRVVRKEEVVLLKESLLHKQADNR